MSTSKFVVSIIGFTLLAVVCIVVLALARFVASRYVVPWELLVALAPAAALLGLIVTVAIDKPLDRL